MELFNYRKSYTKNKLSMNDIGDNPIDFFVKWFKETENSDQIIEPIARQFQLLMKIHFHPQELSY